MNSVNIQNIYTEVNQDNFSGLSDMFGATVKDAWETIKSSTFPDEIEGKINDLMLAKLLYLASFGDGIDKCPFTENQKNILLNSYRWAKTTTWSLKLGLAFNTILFAGVALSPLVPTATGNQTNLQATNATNGVTAVTGGLVTFAALTGVITNAVSFLATGFFPDYSSISSNKEQDVLAEIKETYSNLAGRLIMLYYSKENSEDAIKIARNINHEVLSKKCFFYTHNKMQSRQITTPIRQAVEFILSDETVLPESIGLLNTIEIQKMRFKIF